MWIVPFVGTEPSDDEQSETDDQIGRHHVDPDLERKWRKEREESGVLLVWFLEQNADAEVHEGFGEVNVLFAHVADCQRRHSEVCLLQWQRMHVRLTVDLDLAGNNDRSVRPILSRLQESALSYN